VHTILKQETKNRNRDKTRDIAQSTKDIRIYIEVQLSLKCLSSPRWSYPHLGLEYLTPSFDVLKSVNVIDRAFQYVDDCYNIAAATYNFLDNTTTE
jgi:hypothetical protein